MPTMSSTFQFAVPNLVLFIFDPDLSTFTAYFQMQIYFAVVTQHFVCGALIVKFPFDGQVITARAGDRRRFFRLGEQDPMMEMVA